MYSFHYNFSLCHFFLDFTYFIEFLSFSKIEMTILASKNRQAQMSVPYSLLYLYFVLCRGRVDQYNYWLARVAFGSEETKVIVIGALQMC